MAGTAASTFRRVVVYLAGIITLLLVVFLVPFPRPAYKPLSWTVSALSTNASGQVEGVFAVSNTLSRSVYYGLPRFDVWRQGHWQESIYSNRWGFGTLEPGQTTNLVVAAPTDGLAWRVTLWWEVAPGFREMAGEMVRENWAAFHRGTPLPGMHVSIGLTGTTQVSPEIELPIFHPLSLPQPP